MIKYILKRLFGLIPVLFMISFVSFIFIHLLPGDPVKAMLGQEASIEETIMLRHKLGLDQPLIYRYFIFLKNAFMGDLGTSIRTGVSVSSLIKLYFPNTFILSIVSLFWSIILGVIIGVYSAINKGKIIDKIITLSSIAGLSMPTFWFAMLLVDFFAIRYNILPSSGFSSFSSLIMPSLTLGFGVVAFMSRFVKTSFLDIMGEEYITTAYSKGLLLETIVWKHAFKNALIPILTVGGLQFGYMLSGSIIVEKIFRWPGIGALLIDSIIARDYSVIQALILMFSLVFLIINLIVDILYGVVNPAVRNK